MQEIGDFPISTRNYLWTRLLMARGRETTDVAIVTSFGTCTLAGFKVTTDQLTSASLASTKSL